MFSFESLELLAGNWIAFNPIIRLKAASGHTTLAKQNEPFAPNWKYGKALGFRKQQDLREKRQFRFGTVQKTARQAHERRAWA
jgi:hypothetical protein